ncbi:MAG: restriction endonuclease [Nanoarchaeota archaeon]|nr:restriction endonuclease [Nanoarchaeota archaeon]
MYVTKASGEKEKLNLKKLKKTILSAGASERLANRTIKEVRNKVYSGMKTKEILSIVLKMLKNEPGVAQRYSLKRAIMMLGPTGFPFEKFVARVLKEYDYETRTNVIVKGKCVRQEIDVVAKKGKKKYMIECKYRNAPGKKSDLKVAMYTYARFLDVKHKKFSQPWLVTNTKCTTEAIKYAKGMKLKIISWNYPKDKALENILVRKNLYPITTIGSLNFDMKRTLIKANIVLVRDLLKHKLHYLMSKTKLSKKILERLRKEAKQIIET